MRFRLREKENQAWDPVKKLWNPFWKKESEWNPGKDKFYIKTNAYPPKVTVKNELFPRPHEIYNCTTCTHGEPEHPAYKIQNPDNFRVKCRPTCPVMGNLFKAKYSEGPRFDDIGCDKWDRRDPRPRKGYTPEIDEV